MIRIFFGSPGAGKTTFIVSNLVNLQKKRKYEHFYSNVETNLNYVSFLDCRQLSDCAPLPCSHISIDESGIEYNSRKTLSLPQGTIAFFKLHRKYKCDIDFYSQSWDDIDITVRRLADEIWYIKKLGPLSLARRIVKRIDIDKESGQIIDKYEKKRLITKILPPPFHYDSCRFLWRPKYYKYFDSWDAPQRPSLPTVQGSSGEVRGFISFIKSKFTIKALFRQGRP